MGACIESTMIPAAIDRPAEAAHSPEGDGALRDDVSQTWSEQSDGWRQLLAGAADYLLRRVSGDFQADESGFDPEFNSSVLMPVAGVLYRNWFRVRMRGLQHVPAAGPALMVANHSGVLPFDAVMLQTGVFNEHPAHRNLRLLGADLVYTVPVLANLARMSGHTRACPTGCCAPGNWSGSSPRVSKESGSRSASAISCSGSAGAGSRSRRSRPGCRSFPARLSALRRSIR